MGTPLVWDEIGKRFYETGVDHGVLFVAKGNWYDKGVAWNGLTTVTEKPSGAEQSAIYADNIKYLNLTSAEDFGCTIEAYTYPDAWMECDGSAEITNGVIAGQQSRKGFAFAYRSRIGNDVDGDSLGYKLHLVYGCKASPSERGYSTVNDSPEAISFSWDVSTTPIAFTGETLKNLKPTALLTIDSTKVDPDKLAAFEKILYGSEDGEDSKMPTPDEVFAAFKVDSVSPGPDDVEG